MDEILKFWCEQEGIKVDDCQGRIEGHFQNLCPCCERNHEKEDDIDSPNIVIFEKGERSWNCICYADEEPKLKEFGKIVPFRVCFNVEEYVDNMERGIIAYLTSFMVWETNSDLKFRYAYVDDILVIESLSYESYQEFIDVFGEECSKQMIEHYCDDGITYNKNYEINVITDNEIEDDEDGDAITYNIEIKVTDDDWNYIKACHMERGFTFEECKACRSRKRDQINWIGFSYTKMDFQTTYDWNDLIRDFEGKSVENLIIVRRKFQEVLGIISNGGDTFIAFKKWEPLNKNSILKLQPKSKFLSEAKDHIFYYTTFEKDEDKKQKTISIKKVKKPMTFRDFILKNQKSLLYDDIVFCSKEKTKGRKVLDVFSGFKAKIVDNIEEAKIQPILDHIKLIWSYDKEKIKQEENFNYILNWLAFLIQKPHIKIGSALVLISDEGAGKNIIADFLLKHIIGIAGIIIDKIELITGRFNSIIENKLLIVCNEVSSEYGKGRKNFDVMKSLITDDVKQIEKKGMDPYTSIDLSNFIFFSNHETCVPLTSKDRRFFVNKLSSERIGDSEYFDNLLTYTKSQDVADHFFSFLMNRDISNFKPNKIPKTEIKEDIAVIFEKPSIQFIKQFDWEDSEYQANHLFDLFKQWKDTNGLKKDETSSTAFAIQIKDLVNKRRAKKGYIYSSKI